MNGLINFGLLDTNAPQKIASSIPDAYQNAIAQRMAQAAQVRQNKLADLQLSEAQRQAEDGANWRNALRGATDFNDPATMRRLRQVSPEKAMSLESSLMNQRKAKADTRLSELKVSKETHETAIKDISALNSPQEAFASITRHAQSGDIPPEAAQALLSNLPTDPAAFGQWKAGLLKNLLDAKARLDMDAPKVDWVDNGTSKVPVNTNPYAGPIGQVQGVSPIKMGITPGQQATLAQSERHFQTNQASEPKTPVAYIDPATGKAVWGTIKDAKGNLAANYSPDAQAALTTAKTTAQETAKDQVEAKANLPKAISNGEEALGMIDEIRKHPGKNIAVGGSSILGIQHIPGTDAKDFVNRLEQVKSGAFLTAFETLKGGGQITQIEGEKATQALARMNNATSEKEFDSALNDYERIIRKAVNNAKLRAGSSAKTESTGTPMKGQVENGYRFKGGNPADPNAWEKI